jgi:hypothetical protein
MLGCDYLIEDTRDGEPAASEVCADLLEQGLVVIDFHETQLRIDEVEFGKRIATLEDAEFGTLDVDFQQDRAAEPADVDALIESLHRHLNGPGAVQTVLIRSWFEKRRAVCSVGYVKLGRSRPSGECYSLKAGASISREDTFVFVSRFGQRLEGDDLSVWTHRPESKAELTLVCAHVDQAVRCAKAHGPQMLSRGGNVMADHCPQESRPCQDGQSLLDPPADLILRMCAEWQLRPLSARIG